MVDQVGLNLQQAASVTMQFIADSPVGTDWSLVVERMGPALQQLQVGLQCALNTVKDDITKNKSTACAKLEDKISGESLVADALVAMAMIGRLSVVAD